MNPDPPGSCSGCGASLVPLEGAAVHAARLDDAIAARDGDGLADLIADPAEIFDHKSGAASGREQWLAGFRSLLLAGELESRHEPIAALGDSLGVLRRCLSATGFAGQPFADAACWIEEIAVVEADPRGRCSWSELFASDRIRDAIVRLYARHAEHARDGSAHARSTAIARSIATVLGPLDPDRIGAVLALDVQYTDHRALGWASARGIVSVPRVLHTVCTAVNELGSHDEEILALRADALLVRRTMTGVIAGARSEFRRRPVVLWAFGADGRVTHWEHFDGDQRDAALERFHALAAPLSRRIRLVETAATRAAQRLAHEVLATRGEHLALAVQRPAEGGSSGTESLLVIELDRLGDRTAIARFDGRELSAARAELDTRYAAGEAARHPLVWASLARARSAMSRRNWEELAGLVSPDFAAVDHRPLGWGIARSPGEYADAIRTLSELRADVVLRLDHLDLAERAALLVATWTGNESEGAFEIPLVLVFSVDADGRVHRIHHYALEQFEEARARFATPSA